MTEIPSPGSALGTEAAEELLDAISGLAKDTITSIENAIQFGPLLETDHEHLIFLGGVRAGALATWVLLGERGLLNLPAGDDS